MRLFKCSSSILTVSLAAKRAALQFALCAPLIACAASTDADDLDTVDEDSTDSASMALNGQIDRVRVQAILAAYDDGSHKPWVTAADIRAALQQANPIYGSANIEFTFDPASDILEVNSTLLARDCTLQPGANMTLPASQEPPCDYDSHNNERNKVARGYPGKVVVYFSSGDRPRYDENNHLWVYAPRTFFWSNGTDSFVAMGLGAPGETLAHEVGHYLHLPHTFGVLPKTVADARTLIRDYIEANQLSKARGYDLFDWDGIADTPADPGSELFVSAGLNPCNINQGTLNLSVPFSDGSLYTYTFSPDRENIMNYWDKTCRGLPAHITQGQTSVVRQAVETGNRKPLTDMKLLYSAVWEPGITGQSRAIGWALSDFATRFNQEIAAGKHFTHMQAYDIGGGQIRYDGVWESGSRGTTRALSWAFSDFVTRHQQELASGKHLVHMQAYNIGSGIRYDGVWESGATGQTWVMGWSLSDFAAHFNQEIAAGKHLVHMQAYDIGGGQIRYDGVWEPGNQGTTRAISWALSDFATRFNQEVAAGKHLVHMQAYDIGGGQIRYDGVWESGNRGTTRALSWAFNDFVARNETEVASGKHLAHLQAYDIGDGQVRYDGVWENGTTGQTRLLSESIYVFADRFNKELSAGKHMVLMQAHTGR